MRMEPLNLISGDFGPFRPQIAAQVPLWLAVALKKRGKCTIRPPEWMSVEKLTQVLRMKETLKSSNCYHFIMRKSQGFFLITPMRIFLTSIW
ncbi:DNA replication protein psf2 [Datura stramonium]|uniref:DNA replication protein psf2 n=1 Tax=Datura stramonium TaxID=4076 RepID=A0ABS8SZJ6_DATST|nr:DNA replication protein psf2 [Datura stramonium]